MKTLVGTPDPEPAPQQPYTIWSGSNASGWITFHPSSTIAVTFTR